MQSSLFEREVDSLSKLRPLYDDQSDALVQVREAIRAGHRRIMLQAATGWGKTRWAASVIQGALHKGSKPLFTAPAISLIDQTVASFEHDGISDIGVMQARHPRTNPNAALQVATPQTLIRRECPDVNLVIIDEAHETFDGLDALLDARPDLIVIGLSATPWTKGLGLRWTKLIIAATVNDLIAKGRATPAVIYGPERDIDRSSIKIVKGEFEEAGSAAAMSEASIVGDVIKEWKERSTQEKTFAFCVNRAHAQVQMEAFLDCGIPFGYIDANTPQGTRDTEKGTRKHAFAQMRNGEIAGIASVGCLIRGVDEDVRTILDLALTKSDIRHVQKNGRGVRTAPGKTHLLVNDHAGNNAALGLFTDIYHDSLDMRKPGDRGEAYKDDYKPAKPKKCAKCHNLIPPRMRNCPSCNERVALNTGVTVVDGRLVEIGSGPKIDMKERQDWYSGFLWIAKRRNYKDGYAARAYKERFGDWPKHLRVRAKEPSSAIVAFAELRRKEYLAKVAVPVAVPAQEHVEVTA